ncbi:hypothetical protein ACG2LH_16165 [Zhouia sp. PK063]|uniref:hypothetical protein n=1 Tax=Zhouia sp. PK063 TaxID=3373602 RepID=UPI003788CFD3
MIVKIISSVLLLASTYIGISHGLRVFKTPTAQNLAMMSALGISNTSRITFGIVSIISVILIIFPKTFYLGNTIRAVILIIFMCLALKAGNYPFALMEIPIIMIPMVLIYLGHPLKMFS